MAATVTVTECVDVSPHRRIYTVELFGTAVTTTVTSTPSVIRRWLYHASCRTRGRFHRTVVGMGVQWHQESGPDEAATLQICVGRSCLIVQLCYTDSVPRVLRRFLLDPSYVFVGVWNHSDARRLAECHHNLQMARPPLDLRLHAETDDGDSLRQASFEEIVEECLGYEGVGLERDISMSNWELRVLTDEQVSQATVDAYLSFRLGVDVGACRF